MRASVSSKLRSPLHHGHRVEASINSNPVTLALPLDEPCSCLTGLLQSSTVVLFENAKKKRSYLAPLSQDWVIDVITGIKLR